MALGDSGSLSPSDYSCASIEGSATPESYQGNDKSFRFTVEEFRAASPQMGRMKAIHSAPQLADKDVTLSSLLSPVYRPQMLPKSTAGYNIPQFNDRELEGVWLPDQQWSDACRDSLRKALLVQTQTDRFSPDTESAPTSMERIEVMKSTLPKNEAVRPESRKNSILSSLNVKLDVIPERVEDEKENPDDYEYSDINLYF